jgi:MoxR-like ATPase
MTSVGDEPALETVARRSEAVLAEIERAIVGKRETLELILLALLSDGHVLIEDNPGLAKTLIARSFATATGLRFARVQFTPDLMPSDITGASVYDQRTGTFEFRPGPIFTNILLGDEINRAPPKTQAALLEAMQERQVTSDDRTRALERPFLVLATQNPIEYEGTYALPEAQLDRFLVRVSVGYPSAAEEREIIARRMARQTDETDLTAQITGEQLLQSQRAVEAAPGRGRRGQRRQPTSGANARIVTTCKTWIAQSGRIGTGPEELLSLSVVRERSHQPLSGWAV